MSATDSAHASLGPAVAALRTMFTAAACSIALVDADGEVLEYVASDGAGETQIIGVTIPVGRGIAGWAAMSGQPIAVRDVQVDARFARDVAESTHYLPTAIYAAPLLDRDGDVLGVASVLDPVVDQSSDWVLKVLGAMAGLLALVVEVPQGPGVTTPLDRLGADVLRLVETWQGEPGEGRR
jgi:signal transduction protein with GAF and PtsI domain